MSESNESSYLDALKNMSQSENTEDPIKIRLSEKSAKQLELIMNYMEWDLLTAINSSIVYSYKKFRSKLLIPLNTCGKKDEDEIKLELSIKNKHRIESLIEAGGLDSNDAYRVCVINSIFILYKSLKIEDKSE